MNLKMFIKNVLNILFTTFDYSKNLIFSTSDFQSDVLLLSKVREIGYFHQNSASHGLPGTL